MAEITFLGHACFLIDDGDTRLLIDPFLTGNPKAAKQADEVDPTHILLTHGHADHLGDTVDIAKRTGAPVVAIVELANEISGNGVEDVRDPNLGGTGEFRRGRGGAHYVVAPRDAVPGVGSGDRGVVVRVQCGRFPPIETDAETFKSDVE